jgi:hypothetical protein
MQVIESLKGLRITLLGSFNSLGFRESVVLFSSRVRKVAFSVRIQ